MSLPNALRLIAHHIPEGLESAAALWHTDSQPGDGEVRERPAAKGAERRGGAKGHTGDGGLPVLIALGQPRVRRFRPLARP